jgi:hypothetical protein
MYFRKKVTYVGNQRITEEVRVVMDPVRVITDITLETVEEKLEVLPEDNWMKRDARYG